MSSNKHRKRRKLNVKRVLSFLIPIILVLACATVFFTFFIRSGGNKPEEPGNPVEYVSIKESSETQSDIPVPDIGEGTEVNGTVRMNRGRKTGPKNRKKCRPHFRMK